MNSLGVILDMDGLLVDSEQVSVEIWEQVALDFNLCLPKKLWLSLIGKRNQEILQILQEAIPQHLVTELDQVFHHYFNKSIENKKIPPKPGAHALIQYLIQTKTPWGIATGSHKDKTLELLTSVELVPFVHHLVCGDEVKQGKPHPETFLALAEKIQVSPQHCFVLEDSAPGLTAGLAAGMHTIHIPGLAPVTEDLKKKIHRTYPSLYEFLEYLKKHKHSVSLSS